MTNSPTTRMMFVVGAFLAIVVVALLTTWTVWRSHKAVAAAASVQSQQPKEENPNPPTVRPGPFFMPTGKFYFEDGVIRYDGTYQCNDPSMYVALFIDDVECDRQQLVQTGTGPDVTTLEQFVVRSPTLASGEHAYKVIRVSREGEHTKVMKQGTVEVP